MSTRIITGDCRVVLRTLAPASVHCCVTSPPYFGLRDYGTGTWEGGDPGCDHAPSTRAGSGRADGIVDARAQRNRDGVAGAQKAKRCKCGAIRTDNQIGLEPTPDAFVAEMVAVFREVKRVLRDDGTLWLNLGDTYASSWPCNRRNVVGSGSLPNGKREARPPRMGEGLKEKDLIGIPWMVAFALRADGWYLRSDIIWHKPNPMPESVTDRPTSAHEHVFLFAKSARYFYDAEAVREAQSQLTLAMYGHRDEGIQSRDLSKYSKQSGRHDAETLARNVNEDGKRNLRNVWTVATQPYSDAHFATFPPALIEPCIKAGCPVGGTVLDPFFGAGTTGLVADRLGRNCVGIELNPGYTGMAGQRVSDDAGLFAQVTNEAAK